MKQKIICCFSLIVVVLLTTFLCLPPKDADILKNTKELKKQNVLAIMIETGEATDTYQESTSGSWPTDGYKFNRKLSRCTNGGELSWDKEKKIVSLSGNSDDKCYVYFDVGVESIADYCDTGTDLATCVKNFGDQGPAISNIYIHNSSLVNGAGDNSYRYAGASDKVNNFVCFGSTAATCPTDNLYRIIGVIDGKVKLIKYDYANSNLLGTDGDYSDSGSPNSSYYKGSLSKIDRYSWNYKNNTSINNGCGSNEWSTSLLNKINLNTNYLNNIGTTWSNLIEDATWKVSGHSTSEVTPTEMYTGEIKNAIKTYGPSDGTSKIGLMYLSDYGFAASPSAWTTTLYNYSGNDVNGTSIKTINWMYMGYDDWTISTKSSNSYDVFLLYYNGNVNSIIASSGYGSRPVMYLKASVLYAGGSGTKNSPITLVV